MTFRSKTEKKFYVDKKRHEDNQEKMSCGQNLPVVVIETDEESEDEFEENSGSLCEICGEVFANGKIKDEVDLL